MSHTDSDTQLCIHTNARPGEPIDTTENGAPTVDALAEILSETAFDPPRAVVRRAQQNLEYDARDDDVPLSNYEWIVGYEPVDRVHDLRAEAMRAGRLIAPHPDDDREPEATEDFEQYQSSVRALVELAEHTAKIGDVSPKWSAELDLGCADFGENLSCFHAGRCGDDLERPADLMELDPETWEYRQGVVASAANRLQDVWWVLGLRPDLRTDIVKSRNRIEDVQERISDKMDHARE